MEPKFSENREVSTLLSKVYLYEGGGRQPSPEFEARLQRVFNKMNNNDRAHDVGSELIRELLSYDGTRAGKFGPHDLSREISLVQQYMDKAGLNGTGALVLAVRQHIAEQIIEFNQQQSQFNQKLSELNQIQSSETTATKNRHDAMEKNWLYSSKQFEDLQTKLSETHNALGFVGKGESRIETLAGKLEATENELEALKSTLEEKFKLHEAVTLWEARGQTHQTAYEWHRNVCLGLAVVMILIGLIAVIMIDWDTAFTAGFSFGNAAKFALIALIGSLGLVIFRIAMRIALSNLHLKVESENRAVLASLYLNLNEQIEAAGNQELSDQQRAIVLSALFQPSTVGIIKDEGFSLDPSIAAGVAKLLSKK